MVEDVEEVEGEGHGHLLLDRRLLAKRHVQVPAWQPAQRISASGAAITADLDATDAVIDQFWVIEDVDLRAGGRGSDVAVSANVARDVHAFNRASTEPTAVRGRAPSRDEPYRAPATR